MSKFQFKLVLSIVAVLLLHGHLAAQSGSEITFNRHVRPILSDKCFHCHGPDESTREADLRLDQKSGALSVIEPGNLNESDFFDRIQSDDEDYMMPPPHIHKPLTKEEISILKAWIESGVVWDEHWAYVEPKPSMKKMPSESKGFENWIDELVHERLNSRGIKPNPPADPTTLIRRLHFDLTGLPPTPQIVEDFRKSPSDKAYNEIVDSLLASPQFGEQLATYWLDLVRYADTVGYHGDQDQNIAPYREWIIRALNDNMPFDQFTREQLAGDLLPDPTIDQKIASAYNRLLQTTHEGGLQAKEYRAIYQADRVRNLSAVWMGATVGCAQCHDHKYDPYTMKDFYSMAAFFADIDDESHFKNGTNSLPTRRTPEITILTEDETKKKSELQDLLAELTKSLSEKEKTTKGSNDESRKKELEKLKGDRKTLENKINAIDNQGYRTMISQPLETPRVVRILPRGNWLDESGEIVTPAVPEFLGTIQSKEERPTRIDLANWLTDANQKSGKLTARVMSNRIWFLFLGSGISPSLDDFGGQGQAPFHPELLDQLALEFAKDWDIKRLIKLIVTSQTYRQSSQATADQLSQDPVNEFFARQGRFRLPAESVRDMVLATSGLLNMEELGGKSIKPYQPAGYYRHLNFPNRKYSHTTDSNQYRRSVYVHWQRMFLHPTLKALDAPSREECTCQRTRSNTPLAALSLLNDPGFVEAARVFAENLVAKSEMTFEQKLDLAFLRVVSRSPSQKETELLRELFEANRSEYQANPTAADELIEIGLAPKQPSLDPVAVAAWTSVTRALLNMSEAITRN